MMRRLLFLLGVVPTLAACGQSEQGSNQVQANATPAKQDRPAYCFFKDVETKGWTASRDAQGNIFVKGKAYRSDPRYQAVFGKPTINGSHAEVAPTIQPNATGFAAPGNWWEISAAIPNSKAVESVTVKCGKKTLAELKLPPKG